MSETWIYALEMTWIHVYALKNRHVCLYQKKTPKYGHEKM